MLLGRQHERAQARQGIPGADRGKEADVATSASFATASPLKEEEEEDVCEGVADAAHDHQEQDDHAGTIPPQQAPTPSDDASAPNPALLA